MIALLVMACFGDLPPSELVVYERPWRVEGADHEALQASLLAEAPRPGAAGRTRVFSSTTCQAGPRHEGVLDVSLSVLVEVELPVWEPPAGVSVDLVDQWTVFVGAVRDHELGHADIARRGLGGLDASLVGLGSCAEVFRAADRAVAAVKRRQDGWDRTHGAIGF